jgi:hypothetical protein
MLANTPLRLENPMTCMRNYLFALALVPLLGTSSKAADDFDNDTDPHQVTAVLELFTSQGCSSCPPADALLKTLSAKRGVMALSLPVDYWDYIGWKDTFASPKNTARQRAYARIFSGGAVYTPQVVVNGTAGVVGSDKSAIEDAIARTSSDLSNKRVPVRMWHQGSTIVIETGAAPDGASPKEATVWFAVLTKSGQVSVKGGENNGKSLSYVNVVREMTPVGVWTGKPAIIQLAIAAVMRPDTEESIVLIQEGTNGPIIGAAWMSR